jgi:hypothetical protein
LADEARADTFYYLLDAWLAPMLALQKLGRGVPVRVPTSALPSVMCIVAVVEICYYFIVPRLTGKSSAEKKRGICYSPCATHKGCNV